MSGREVERDASGTWVRLNPSEAWVHFPSDGPPRCVTCKHWDRVYDDIGVCERIHRYGYRESTPVWIGTDNVDDVADLGGPDLRTLATFGCTEWAAQEDQT